MSCGDAVEGWCAAAALVFCVERVRGHRGRVHVLLRRRGIRCLRGGIEVRDCVLIVRARVSQVLRDGWLIVRGDERAGVGIALHLRVDVLPNGLHRPVGRIIRIKMLPGLISSTVPRSAHPFPRRGPEEVRQPCSCSCFKSTNPDFIESQAAARIVSAPQRKSTNVRETAPRSSTKSPSATRMDEKLTSRSRHDRRRWCGLGWDEPVQDLHEHDLLRHVEHAHEDADLLLHEGFLIRQQ